jgi:hypothetical protein
MTRGVYLPPIITHHDLEVKKMKDDLDTTGLADYLGINRDTAKRLMGKIPGAYKWSPTGTPSKNTPWKVPLQNVRDYMSRTKYAVGSAKFTELEARGYCDARR